MFLVPGIGAQGADVAAVVHAGQDRNGKGLIINASRAIIFRSSEDNYATIAGQEAEKLKMDINRYRHIR
jgi:orotidine-5'-phosphate decarboxylase